LPADPFRRSMVWPTIKCQWRHRTAGSVQRQQQTPLPGKDRESRRSPSHLHSRARQNESSLKRIAASSRRTRGRRASLPLRWILRVLRADVLVRGSRSVPASESQTSLQCYMQGCSAYGQILYGSILGRCQNPGPDHAKQAKEPCWALFAQLASSNPSLNERQMIFRMAFGDLRYVPTADSHRAATCHRYRRSETGGARVC
jgi:hypothetical protein